VIQVLGLGPHRLSAEARPAWFFERARYGGILCDIGSHQIEQFVFYSGASDATVTSARVANFGHKQYPELEDFGDATLVADNGAISYFRVDWFTPDGLRTWGDGRAFILGTDGYIEMRKYIDVGRQVEGDHLFLVDKQGEQHFELYGKVGFPFFGRLIQDCLNATETAMTKPTRSRQQSFVSKLSLSLNASSSNRSRMPTFWFWGLAALGGAIRVGI
jgi:predicted dehydrogenase